MKTEHTPGPWEYEIPNPECVADAPPFWITCDGKRIADVRVQGSSTESNTQLIAAAPDLRDAIEHVLNVADEDGDMDDIDWKMLCAAISKSKGELK